MDLNSYIKLSTFSQSSVEELEDCFREINDVVSSNMLLKVAFQYNSSLLMSVRMSDGRTLAERLYTFPMPDKQLQTRVIPKLLQMFPDTSSDFGDIEQMNVVFKNDLNSFWGIHFPVQKEYCLRTKDECSKYILDSLWSLMNSNSFEWLYPIILPNIVVADSALAQIYSLGTSNNFGIVIEDLKKLNSFCETWTTGVFSINTLKQSYSIDTSDESNSTKTSDKLRAYRKFQLKDIGTKYCFLHVKHGDYRMHYYPDDNTHKIHIGYVGVHLPI